MVYVCLFYSQFSLLRRRVSVQWTRADKTMRETFVCFFPVVDIFPPEIVSVPGGSAAFTCFFFNLNTGERDSIVEVQWFGNNDPIDRSSSVTVTTSYSNVTMAGKLTLDNLALDWNATTIRCKGIFSLRSPVTSSAAQLLMQGLWIWVLYNIIGFHWLLSGRSESCIIIISAIYIA